MMYHDAVVQYASVFTSSSQLLLSAVWGRSEPFSALSPRSRFVTHNVLSWTPCSWSRSSVNLLVSVARHSFSVSGRHGDWRRWLNIADSLNLCESLPDAKGYHMHQEEIRRAVKNCEYLRSWWCDQTGFSSNENGFLPLLEPLRVQLVSLCIICSKMVK